MVRLLLPACFATVAAFCALLAIPRDASASAIVGDVHCQNELNALDAIEVRRVGSGFPKSEGVWCIELGDSDCDGIIEATDSIDILRYLAGLPQSDKTWPCLAVGTWIQITPSPSPPG